MAHSYGGVRWRKRKRFRFDGDNGLDYTSGEANIIGTGGGGSVVPANALLNDNGQPILNDDGSYILV